MRSTVPKVCLLSCLVFAGCSSTATRLVRRAFLPGTGEQRTDVARAIGSVPPAEEPESLISVSPASNEAQRPNGGRSDSQTAQPSALAGDVPPVQDQDTKTIADPNASLGLPTNGIQMFKV